MRRYVEKDISKGNHLEPVSHLEKEDWQSWEDRVMEDILEMPNVNAPAGFDQEFEKVIAEALNDREASMMKLRYQDGKTFLEIGEQYNLTKTRVQVIVNNALRKLRNPQYRLWLQYGPNYKSELENLNTVQAEYDRAYLQALEKQQKNDKKASLAIMCKVNDVNYPPLSLMA